MIRPWLSVSVLMGCGVALAGSGDGVSDDCSVGEELGWMVLVRVAGVSEVALITGAVLVGDALLVPQGRLGF